jgi:hypothetical protein
MFVGHLVGAELLQDISPSTPPWVALAGVGFPDILWGVTVLTGVEKVQIDRNSPLQKNINFVSFPFSHSLVLGTLIACIPGLIIGLFLGLGAGIVFVLASASHWLLDTVMHLPDLPILGFDGDRKVGFGLWRHGWIAFVGEYLFLVAGTLILVPQSKWGFVLVAGLIFHLLNMNSFVGLTKTNPFKSARAYALVTFVGFAALIYVFQGQI